MSDLPGVPEDGLLANFGLADREQLRRLGLFPLGHALLDRTLVYFLAVMELQETIKKNPLSALDADSLLDSLIAKHANGTFMARLNAVRARGRSRLKL
jgi:hypothetical protein